MKVLARLLLPRCWSALLSITRLIVALNTVLLLRLHHFRIRLNG